MSITQTLRGVLAGAVAMYFLDPARGRRRRAHLRNAVDHARHVEQRLVDKAIRDATFRAQGAVARLRHPMSSDVDDQVLQARVTSQLGRLVSHPSALEVIAHDRAITLRGAILAAEAEAALARVRGIPGVDRVIDELERHETAERVPALQGGSARLGREAWRPEAQLAALVGGALLAIYGTLVRRGLAGRLWAIAGGALALRGGFNLPLARILGRGEGVTVRKTITVAAPVDEVFALWSRFENFPRFMEHVREVERLDETHTRWTIDGPGRMPVTFVTATTHLVPDREICWEAIAGQPLRHGGRVRFELVQSGCRIDVQLTYRPPAGVIGHSIAHLLGLDPKARLDDDLMRMKGLLETGHTRAHGHRVDSADLQRR